MSAGSWDDCLELFSDHLAMQFAALEQGVPDRVVAFVPPPGLGQLPVGLGDRARELHLRSQALTTAVEQARDRTALALERLRRPAERSEPAFLDSRG